MMFLTQLLLLAVVLVVGFSVGIALMTFAQEQDNSYIFWWFILLYGVWCIVFALTLVWVVFMP